VAVRVLWDDFDMRCMLAVGIEKGVNWDVRNCENWVFVVVMARRRTVAVTSIGE